MAARSVRPHPANREPEQLADAMAEEFATSLPINRAGWVEAAQIIVDRVRRESSERKGD